jgi:rSAM/selenodomain-associated transferase 1
VTLSSSIETLGIFVKHPVAGEVKTRLAAERGHEWAASVYSAFIADLATRFRSTAKNRYLCTSPATIESQRYFESLAGRDYEIWPQPELELGSRMQRFFEDHLSGGDSRVVIIGSDSPTLPREYVERAFEELAGADCVVGPASDGGYYLIGMQGRVWPVFSGIEWSGSRVLDQTVMRLREAGGCLAVLPVWYDVDTPDDWRLLVGHVRALATCGSTIRLEETARLMGLDTANGAGSL